MASQKYTTLAISNRKNLNNFLLNIFCNNRFHSLLLIAESPKMLSSLHDRDAGFCSGSDDDYHSERQQNSPSSTDNGSEDSVDIKLSSIVIPTNKRKPFESIKIGENDVPLKKRIKYDFGNFTEDITKACDEKTPAFRPWIPSELPNEAEVLPRHPAVTTLHRVRDEDADQQEQPLALIAKKSSESPKDEQLKVHLKDDCKMDQPSVGKEKALKKLTKPADSVSNTSQKSNGRQSMQRNYKNMTRERRIEANARERTRVHTISAAFDTLRSAIPSYSNTQKLSKLSVLRVACAYILTLSRMAGNDYSADQSEPSVSSCMEEIAKTIQTEGKVRKRKDE